MNGLRFSVNLWFENNQTMGYSKYKKLKQVTEKFGLRSEKVVFFAQITPIEPSDWLKKTIEMADTVVLSNEKVKSERIISPVLSEVHILHKTKLSLFSGEELNVQPENDLNGPCDFFFSTRPNAYLLEAPIVAMTEAKAGCRPDENMEYGMAQCTAQMVAAQIFNEKAGLPTPTVWGCATTAGEWHFLKLTDQTLYIDTKSYYLDRLDVLLGAFDKVIEQI